jgi:hypothetical protein
LSGLKAAYIHNIFCAGYASDEERDELMWRGAAALDALEALSHAPLTHGAVHSDAVHSDADADNAWMDDYRASALER